MQNKSRLFKKLSNEILELITSGYYSVGSRLPSERELAKQFNVSRPIIRESIIALEAKGVVEVKLGSGIFVKESSPYKNISLFAVGKHSPFDIVEARILLEGEVASLAAKLHSEQELKAIYDNFQIMQTEVKLKKQFSKETDRAFHTSIAVAAHNKTISSIVNQLWKTQENMEYLNEAHRDVCVKDVNQRLDEHYQIYLAIKEKNPILARDNMQKHFARLLAALHETSESKARQQLDDKLNNDKLRYNLNNLGLSVNSLRSEASENLR